MISLSIDVNAMIHETEIRLSIRNNEMQQENEDVLLREADANLIKYAINVRSLVVLGIQVEINPTFFLELIHLFCSFSNKKTEKTTCPVKHTNSCS